MKQSIKPVIASKHSERGNPADGQGEKTYTLKALTFIKNKHKVRSDELLLCSIN